VGNRKKWDRMVKNWVRQETFCCNPERSYRAQISLRSWKVCKRGNELKSFWNGKNENGYWEWSIFVQISYW
jgi:hypothetical protein